MILWTRRPFADGARHLLTVEVAEDADFRRVVAQAPAPVSAASDWTTRVLVGKLKPARTYWYRFTDADGNGSRVGRTITAPKADDPRTVNSREVMARVVERFGDLVFDTVITRTVRFPETSVAGEPITTWAPKSAGAIAYRALAREFIDRFGA